MAFGLASKDYYTINGDQDEYLTSYLDDANNEERSSKILKTKEKGRKKMRVYREPEFESEAFFNHPAELLRKLERRAGLPAESLELQKTEMYLPQLSVVLSLKLYTEIFNIYSKSRGIQVGFLKQRENIVTPHIFPTEEEKAKNRAADAHESPSCFCGYAEIRLQRRANNEN